MAFDTTRELTSQERLLQQLNGNTVTHEVIPGESSLVIRNHALQRSRFSPYDRKSVPLAGCGAPPNRERAVYNHERFVKSTEGQCIAEVLQRTSIVSSVMQLPWMKDKEAFDNAMREVASGDKFVPTSGDTLRDMTTQWADTHEYVKSVAPVHPSSAPSPTAPPKAVQEPRAASLVVTDDSIFSEMGPLNVTPKKSSASAPAVTKKSAPAKPVAAVEKQPAKRTVAAEEPQQSAPVERASKKRRPPPKAAVQESATGGSETDDLF